MNASGEPVRKTIRHALPRDRDGLEQTLIEAFSADPFWQFFFQDPERPGYARHQPLRDCMRVEIDAYLGLGHTYVIEDRAAALWSPPGVHADDGPLAETFGGNCQPQQLEEFFPQLIELGAWRPDEPHFYLHLVGARDNARGQGLGSLLLRRILDICDTEQLPSYLEASSERSAALYRRHGYEQLGEVRFAPDVVLQPMLRPAP